MNPMVAQKLRHMIEEEGQSLVRDPQRCAALISDELANFDSDRSLLNTALADGVAGELLDTRVPLPIQVSRLAKRLEEQRGLRSTVAREVVETWAYALGIMAQPAPSQSATEPAPPPASELRPHSALEETAALLKWATAAVFAAFAVNLVSSLMSVPPDFPNRIGVIAVIFTLTCAGWVVAMVMHSRKSRACAGILTVVSGILSLVAAFQLFSKFSVADTVALFLFGSSTYLCYRVFATVRSGQTRSGATTL
jgi:hypothetical protein